MQKKEQQQHQQHLQQKIEENIAVGDNSDDDNEQVVDKQIEQMADTTKLSKNQLKKQARKQKWDQVKKIKRKQDRQKQKLRKKQRRQELNTNKQQQHEQNNNKHLIYHDQNQGGNKVPIRKRKDEYIEKMQDQVRVVIDLQFYQIMTEKQKVSLAKQLAYCHSVNRKMQAPFNYILTSVTHPILQFLSNQYNVQNYGIKIYEQPLLQLFDTGNIVYLTGDAEQQIQQFKQQYSFIGYVRQVYIIGGIVDHNRLKNITINYAKSNNIRARRLPMDGIKLKASVHLAVNHVWEWMIRKYNGATWGDAIKQVIPQRKLQSQQVPKQ